MRKIKLIFCVRIHLIVKDETGSHLKKITNIVPALDDAQDISAPDYVSPERRLYDFYRGMYPDSVVEVSLAKVNYSLPTE